MRLGAKVQPCRWARASPFGSAAPSAFRGAIVGRCLRQAPGAGLATAFDAPGAGALFVLEELIQKFERRTAIASLATSATAIAVARALLGDTLDFHVAPFPHVAVEAPPLFFLLGAVLGLVAVAYNRTLLATIAAVERLRLPVEARAGLIGAAVGALAWLYPGIVGGGGAITQAALIGGQSLSVVALIFCVRFGLGAISYAAGTPGGLFAPLLVLGAQSGLLFGAACHWAIPSLEAPTSCSHWSGWRRSSPELFDLR